MGRFYDARKFELDQIQANSSQVGGQTIPNSIQVENLARLELEISVENVARVGRICELDQIQAILPQRTPDENNKMRCGLVGQPGPRSTLFSHRAHQVWMDPML